MKRVFRQFRYGEKGFTLIELLVVVAILGILAAVMVPNLGKFMGSGTVEAANTESYLVQTAVIGAMVDTGNSTLTDGGTVGPGHASTVYESDGTTPIPIEVYFSGQLEATYTLDTTGGIVSAIPVADGTWKDLTYTDGRWEKP